LCGFRVCLSGSCSSVSLLPSPLTQGIPQKLHALELFFDRNPQFVDQVVLVQIAIPSRTDVEEYKKLKANMHELVGRINGRFGSVSSVPIHYLDQSIPFDKMCALYRVADCMVITSIRDGMNLVAYVRNTAQHTHTTHPRPAALLALLRHLLTCGGVCALCVAR